MESKSPIDFYLDNVSLDCYKFFEKEMKKSSIFINKGEVGYDGQQFLTIALDPALKNIESISALDNPRYRYRRIMYLSR